ncbi:hypothetical protein [Paraburkholderia sp. A3RO-2L]|jgi:hypothetical protein|uniref:hypothetical protein n=1 Tax=unclassified Paraburkholderia TaxID=2615204 RepID=UPI003DA8C5F0
MSTYVNTALPKICHARVGQKVRLPDTRTGEVQPEVFIVVAKEERGCRPGRPGMSHGLYDDERELSLVSVSTGIARQMPHLSSRAELLPMEELPATPLSSVPTVPRSIPEASEVVVEVELATRNQRRRVIAVNLADVDDVRALLERLQRSEARVVSIEATSGPTEAELKSQWRQAVAKEETLLSFEEYKQAMA